MARLDRGLRKQSTRSHKWYTSRHRSVSHGHRVRSVDNLLPDGFSGLSVSKIFIHYILDPNQTSLQVLNVSRGIRQGKYRVWKVVANEVACPVAVQLFVREQFPQSRRSQSFIHGDIFVKAMLQREIVYRDTEYGYSRLS